MRKRIRERNRTWETWPFSLIPCIPSLMGSSPFSLAIYSSLCSAPPPWSVLAWTLGIAEKVYPALLLPALHSSSPHKQPSCCRPQETLPVTVHHIYELKSL